MKTRRLKIIIGIIGILVVLVSAAVCYLSRPKTHYEFVSNAVVIQPKMTADLTPDRTECIYLLRKNHSLQKEPGVSLIIDFYSPGSLRRTDAAEYSRLTISIRNPEVNHPYNVSRGDLQVYYSSGGAAGGKGCAGNYANTARGSIILKSIEENKIDAKIEIHGKATHTLRPGAEEYFLFVGDYTFWTSSIDAVNRWAGKWE